MKGAGGEIVQVQGGHIIRATGRKDRHSKVYTAKGPRDRRVRLSAHTAIQFYDVQDRLGYDRPSKAVDWLIKKAKPAIDKLAELPPFDPRNANSDAVDGNMGSRNMAMEDHSDSSGYAIQLQRHLGDSPSNDTYAPPSMDSQSLADTMKSFFPTTSTANTVSFQNYPPGIISRGSSQNEDLCLSLHTLQDPNLIQGQSEGGNSSHAHSADQNLFTGSVNMGFEASSSGWPEHQPPDMGGFSRLMAWSIGSGNPQSRGAPVFDSLPIPSQQQALFGEDTSFSQRGTLQSSYSPSVRAWDDLPDHHKLQAMHHPSISTIGSASDGFAGFCIPSQIQGEQVHGVVVSNKAASPNSSH
ncbi:hypothetical protein Nepgr_000385 [Nepenthes gracilis]|uniref:TCP domain-containing protein n=1 Tax=Nepenthes gracilis TaxID=150966 RepID=A0AAD3P331_NEPGR|nr:hypothetical protein Nepgr_000385 [Nepenthes gracilis]